MIKNKTKILDYIACPPEEVREIPDFFERVYEVNREIQQDIEATYKEAEQKEAVDSALGELIADRSKKFVTSIIREMDIRLDEYLLDFPEDKEVEKKWEGIKEKLLSVSLTKRRLQQVRGIWRDYKNNHKDWKRLLKDLSEFLEDKLSLDREGIPPYDSNLLKLITIDFIS